MASDEASTGGTFEVKRGSGPGTPQGILRDDSRSNGPSDERLREDGDPLPPAIRRKYYVAKAEGSQDLKIYADPKGEHLALQTRHDRLTTRVPNAEIVRDMVAIAAHRGWTRIEVTGSVEFRREAWLAASARGIEAKGYEATPLDHAASAKLRDTNIRAAGETNLRRDGQRAGPNESNQAPERKGAERGGQHESQSRDDQNGRSQLALIERIALAAFPKDADARRRVIEVARERIDNHRRRGARFQRVEISERSDAKVRTADQTPTPSSVEFAKLEHGRGGQ